MQRVRHPCVSFYCPRLPRFFFCLFAFCYCFFFCVSSAFLVFGSCFVRTFSCLSFFLFFFFLSLLPVRWRVCGRCCIRLLTQHGVSITSPECFFFPDNVHGRCSCGEANLETHFFPREAEMDEPPRVPVGKALAAEGRRRGDCHSTQDRNDLGVSDLPPNSHAGARGRDGL